jgi:hypothetical protein
VGAGVDVLEPETAPAAVPAASLEEGGIFK